MTQSIHSTGPDIASQAIEPAGSRLDWSGRLSLRQRILAVNVFALALLAGSFFYLDSYRSRLIVERVSQAAAEARLMSTAMDGMTLPERQSFVAKIGRQTGARVRLADRDGHIVADSWAEGPSFTLIDPDTESWQRHVARWLDEAIEFVVDAREPPKFEGFTSPDKWPANAQGWLIAPDLTHMIWATAPVAAGQPMLLRTDRNARDIRRFVRAERTRLGYVIALVSLLSVLLSLFLARTIAKPLQLLVSAAVRVQAGRDREVNVPRLPSRNDEIGRLARALSDMTHALRQRIDATEAFAADVAHEIKNPLASLSSAAEGLRTVTKPELRAQLQDIIKEDVYRLDRLITDIADLSRIDAKLARTRFEPVDIGKLIENLLQLHKARAKPDNVEIAFARPHAGTAMVMGDPSQLSRVIENLLANAISFSPPGGVVRIAATRIFEQVIVTVDDDGPGIPENAREAVFERFHSDRRGDEAFGKHSGLGLSIARTIVNGHNGTIEAVSREPGQQGARIEFRLPALEV
ncbi:sensor histidine kinase [Aquisediminimonas profunda]|uniref:sensor histidine kinase n=1 Tax=Aquisediminimonas profunda TaxID=1550733 RepID=UPI001FEAAC5B|nr:ATP-binding protein [Aquisediminimonas profunda]